jgi:cytoskeleton protein RodZ
MSGRVEDGMGVEVGTEGPVRAGALLRDARERSGRSVEDCAVALRSRAMQIHALERGDLQVFGGDVYARGFLRSYARLLGVSEREVLDLHGHDPSFGAPVATVPTPLRLRRGVPGWMLAMLAVVVVAGVLATVLTLGGRRAPEVAQSVDPGVDAPGAAVEEPSVVPEPSPEAPAPEPAAGPPIDLVLAFEANSWLEVLVDGLVRESGVLVRAGETLRFTGQEQVVLRFGNAGGVRVEANGEDLGALGRSGQVLRVTFGPDGLVDGDG